MNKKEAHFMDFMLEKKIGPSFLKGFLHVVESISVRDKNYEVVVGLEATE